MSDQVNKQQKTDWYELLIEKMSVAIKNEFYFEVLFIAYMIIDDRIKSLSKLRNIKTETDNGKPIMLGNLMKELNKPANRDGITGCLFDIPMEVATDSEIKLLHDNDYFKEQFGVYLKATTRKLCCPDLIKPCKDDKIVSYLHEDGKPRGVLQCVTAWKEERNHWMHQAGDDCLSEEELKEKLSFLALDGAILARELCDLIRRNRKRLQRNPS